MTSRTRGLKDILWIFALFGLMAAIFRLWYGLGATTNLTDSVPWGLWKVLNMIAGVAISTSGFTVGFLVYVLKIEKFRPLVKPAILVAFLGYGCSCCALLFDIGLPHRFWHPFFMWNEHSFLFEVFWCVILYFTVTSIELSPAIIEKFKSEKIVKFLHHIAFGVVVVGISLSSLHHSSLGSLFLVTPQRLHPLWYSPLLPLFFILSAMGAGMMFLILVKILYARWYNPESVFGHDSKENGFVCVLPVKSVKGNGRQPFGKEMPMLRSLASIAAAVLSIYLVLKVYDLIASDKWQILTANSWESWLYGFELLIAVVIPVMLVLIPRTRYSPNGLAIAALSASAGLALNRLDVGIFGYFHDAGEVYFPTMAEWALGIGVIAAAGLVFLFVVERFSIFDDSWKKRTIFDGLFNSSFDSLSRVWNTTLSSGLQRVTAIAIFVLPLSWVLMYPPFSKAEGMEVRPASGIDIQRATLRIDGNRDGVFTDFPHIAHQQKMGGESSCATCHHLSMPNDLSTPCSRCHRDMLQGTVIFVHSDHEKMIVESKKLTGIHPVNYSCDVCHTVGEARTAQNALSCLECHRQDMGWKDVDENSVDIKVAISYGNAMHQTCIQCHEKEAVAIGRKNLGECSTCHKSREQRPVTSGEMASLK